MKNRPSNATISKSMQKYWWLVPVLAYLSARLAVESEMAFLISVHCGILAGVAAESRHHWKQSWFWWLFVTYSLIKSAVFYWFSAPIISIGMLYLPIAFLEAYLLFLTSDKFDKFLDRRSRGPKAN